MHADVERLTRLIDRAVAMLRKRGGDDEWIAWLEKDAALLRAGDAYGLEHLLQAFGGQGSLTDLTVDETFDDTLADVYDLARALWREQVRPPPWKD